MKTFCIDIDGTICSITKDRNYEDAIPDKELIRKINKLYERGYKIKIYTARGMASGMDFTDITKMQLKDWGVKYHELIMNKPSADYYVDDKSFTPDLFMNMF
jgi:histidinol phosphatase-like enzyme